MLLALASLLVHVVVIGGDGDLVGPVGLLLTTVVARLEVKNKTERSVDMLGHREH